MAPFTNGNNMKIPKEFWSEEAKEPAHRKIKKQLEKAGSKKKDPKHMSKKASTLAKNPSSKNAKHSFEKERMHEFKSGHMHSRKKGTGPVVTNPKQAIAIMLSEERKKGVKVPKKK
jgi:hypothetical protein